MAVGDDKHPGGLAVIREKAEQRAADEGLSLSALTREALERYLAS